MVRNKRSIIHKTEIINDLSCSLVPIYLWSTGLRPGSWGPLHNRTVFGLLKSELLAWHCIEQNIFICIKGDHAIYFFLWGWGEDAGVDGNSDVI